MCVCVRRLHSIGRLELHFSLAIMCLHLTKLCLLYPCPHSPTPLTSSLLPLCSTFLTSFLLIRLFLFDHSPRLSGGRLLVYSAMLLVGLLLSVDTFVSPLWASLTHTLPSSASLVGMCNWACTTSTHHPLPISCSVCSLCSGRDLSLC